jgi:hypothetical protein
MTWTRARVALEPLLDNSRLQVTSVIEPMVPRGPSVSYLSLNGQKFSLSRGVNADVNFVSKGQ